MSHQLDKTTTTVTQGIIFYKSLDETMFAEYTYSDACIYMFIPVLYDQEEREERV
jgi:hypothetical protein